MEPKRLQPSSFFNASSIIKNDSKHSKPIIRRVNKTVGSIANSVTFDNGKEFASHAQLGKKNKINTYFNKKGSPWEKGSVENANKITRQFIPFNTKPSDVTQDLLDRVARHIDNTPRKILNFLTLSEVFMQDYPQFLTQIKSRLKLAMPAIEANMMLNNEFVRLDNQKCLNVALHT